MKRKKGYSLTSKERKQMRLAEEEKARAKANKSDEKPDVAETEITENGEAAVAKQYITKKQMWIMITCIILALVIILTAVLMLVLIPKFAENSKYPRATITLDDGRQLNMVIWEEECPIAATNFIFLAKIGFFDGTIIYDVQPNRNFMRFGAYKGYGKNDSRYEDADFINGIPQSKFNVVNVDPTYKNQAQSNKFGYRLKKDISNDRNRFGEQYVVSFNNYNAADFVINLGEGNTNFTNQSGNKSWNEYLCAFGKFEDEKSQEILDELYNREKNFNTGDEDMVGTNPPIKIKSVSISNYSKKRWKRFEFVSYMNTAYDGKSAWLSWRA